MISNPVMQDSGLLPLLPQTFPLSVGCPGMKPHCQYLFFLTCCLYLELVLILEPNRGSCLGFNIKLCSCHLLLLLTSLFPNKLLFKFSHTCLYSSNLFLSSFFGFFLLYVRNTLHNNCYTQTLSHLKILRKFPSDYRWSLCDMFLF